MLCTFVDGHVFDGANNAFTTRQCRHCEAKYLLRPPPCASYLSANQLWKLTLFKVYPTTTGELDQLLSGVEHAHFVASPYVCRERSKIHLKWLFLRFDSVFGAPPAADKKQLLIVLAGEYKIKKEIAPIVVPAIGRKVGRP